MVYRLRLMGPFELLSPGGQPVRIAAKKSQALLAMLALAKGAPVPRSRLMTVLWGDRGEEQARNSLRQALAGLRKLFAAPGLSPLRVTDDSVAIDPAAVVTDICEPEGTLAPNEFLQGLYISGDAAEDWLRDERHRAAERCLEAQQEQLARLEAGGDVAGAIAAAQALTALDPLNERAHRALMKLYATRGDRALALRQYQICRDALARELDIAPEAETEALHESLRRGAAMPKSGEETPAATLPLPDKPSVAVLPFVNKSGDAKWEYFSDGIAEGIITGLTRFRELFVIAGKSSAKARDADADVRQIGRLLGVVHIVEGTVRTIGDRVRVTAQLVDARSGRRVWAEHYDRAPDDIFAVQDEITRVIVVALAGHLEDAGHHRAIQKPVKDMATYDYLLRGRHCLKRGTKDDVLEARSYFERGLELDPDCAAICAYLADSYVVEYESDWTDARLAAIDHAFRFAERAVALDPADGAAWHALAWARLDSSQHDLARIAIERAIALNPNEYDNLCVKGWCLALSGETGEGIACLNEAIRVNPFAAVDCIIGKGIAEYTARQYEAAVRTFGRLSGRALLKNACLAACYAQLGRDGEARSAVALVRELARSDLAAEPGAEFEGLHTYLRAVFPFQDPSNFGHLLDGLQKAGLAGRSNG